MKIDWWKKIGTSLLLNLWCSRGILCSLWLGQSCETIQKVTPTVKLLLHGNSSMNKAMFYIIINFFIKDWEISSFCSFFEPVTCLYLTVIAKNLTCVQRDISGKSWTSCEYDWKYDIICTKHVTKPLIYRSPQS